MQSEEKGLQSIDGNIPNIYLFIIFLEYLAWERFALCEEKGKSSDRIA